MRVVKSQQRGGGAHLDEIVICGHVFSWKFLIPSLLLSWKLEVA
jgi:hypothetical protein